MFLGEYPLAKVFGGVAIEPLDRLLQEDRSAIQAFVNKMNGATGDLHPVIERLMLRIDAGEGRQERRMSIDDFPRKT